MQSEKCSESESMFLPSMTRVRDWDRLAIGVSGADSAFDTSPHGDAIALRAEV